MAKKKKMEGHAGGVTFTLSGENGTGESDPFSRENSEKTTTLKESKEEERVSARSNKKRRLTATGRLKKSTSHLCS